MYTVVGEDLVVYQCGGDCGGVGGGSGDRGGKCDVSVIDGSSNTKTICHLGVYDWLSLCVLTW